MAEAATRNDPRQFLLLRARGDAAGAIACYRAALAIAPELSDIHFNLANALAEIRAGDHEAALASYHRALELDPAHSGAYNNLGNLLRKLQRPADAIEFYRRALHLRPQDTLTRYNLGTALLDLPSRRGGADLVRTGRPRSRRTFYPAVASAGEALLRLGRAREALQWFRDALRLRPGDVQARLGEGLALLTLGRFRDGWESFEARLEDPRVRNGLPEVTGPHWRGSQEDGDATMPCWCTPSRVSATPSSSRVTCRYCAPAVRAWCCRRRRRCTRCCGHWRTA